VSERLSTTRVSLPSFQRSAECCSTRYARPTAPIDFLTFVFCIARRSIPFLETALSSSTITSTFLSDLSLVYHYLLSCIAGRWVVHHLFMVWLIQRGVYFTSTVARGVVGMSPLPTSKANSADMSPDYIQSIYMFAVFLPSPSHAEPCYHVVSFRTAIAAAFLILRYLDMTSEGQGTQGGRILWGTVRWKSDFGHVHRFLLETMWRHDQSKQGTS
jgi:hypothetical protein